MSAENPADDRSRTEREAQAAYRRTHSPDGHSLGSAKYPNNREGRRALARSWKRMNQ